MENVLFFAGVELVAVLVCAPFALRRETPMAARRAGIGGVLVVSVLTTLFIGLIMDDWNLKSGIAWIFLPLVTAPIALVVGVIAGAVFAKRVSRRATLDRAG